MQIPKTRIILALLLAAVLCLLIASGKIRQTGERPNNRGERIWTNDRLDYQFSYPAWFSVKYSPQTPDGTCTFVTFVNDVATATITIIDAAAFARHSAVASIGCLPTDAPFGARTSEIIHVAATGRDIRADCATAYYHDELFDSNQTNDARAGKLLTEVVSKSLYDKRCAYSLGEGSLHGMYSVTAEYGKSISIPDAERMSADVREIISSLRPRP